MFGKGKAYPELGGERGMGQGWYGAIGKLAIAALLIGAVLIWRAEAWLHVDVPLEHADVIVVLGGESGQRVIGAAELYHQGVAPKVFVTGSGDGGLIVRRLGMAGVPDAACESQSRSTYENAVLTKKALEASLGPQQAGARGVPGRLARSDVRGAPGLCGGDIHGTVPHL